MPTRIAKYASARPAIATSTAHPASIIGGGIVIAG
jgi:hypothetical protein